MTNGGWLDSDLVITSIWPGGDRTGDLLRAWADDGQENTMTIKSWYFIKTVCSRSRPEIGLVHFVKTGYHSLVTHGLLRHVPGAAEQLNLIVSCSSESDGGLMLNPAQQKASPAPAYCRLAVIVRGVVTPYIMAPLPDLITRNFNV